MVQHKPFDILWKNCNMRGLKEEQRECEFNLGNEQRVLIMKLP